MLYSDKCNKYSNQKNLGVIKSSNLCVAGDTDILTSFGYYTIDKFSGKEVEIWNGKYLSKVTVKKTNDSAKLKKVYLSDGSFIKCTDYHRFKLSEDSIDGGRNSDKINKDECRAGDLKVGMKLYNLQEFPVINNKVRKCSNDFSKFDPYTSGYAFGRMTDETHDCESGFLLDSSNSKTMEIIGKLSTDKIEEVKMDDDEGDYIKVFLNNTSLEVPINSDIKTKIQWLSGLVDYNFSEMDGMLGLKNINYKHQHSLKLFLHTLGVSPIVRPHKRSVLSMIAGGVSKLDTITYDICVDVNGLNQLIKLGLEVNEKFDLKSVSNEIVVVSLEDVEEEEPTWCFTEEDFGQGVFNGTLTYNCAEIIEYSSDDEWACCVLGTLCLGRYVKDGKFDYELLAEHAGEMVLNLDNLIDINLYPVEQTKKSNMRNRPLSIGVQGLADAIMLMNLPSFTSKEAKAVNKKIAEILYYGCLRKSCDLAKERGSYPSYKGSDFSKGILQWHYYGLTVKDMSPEFQDRWTTLIEDIKKYGVRNSLLTGYPPTASSSHIQGSNECFEPYTYIGYVRKTLCGEFYITCDHFTKDCMDAGVYTAGLMKKVANEGGSVQNIPELPDWIKKKYQTAWELSNKDLIDMARDRQYFIDQSQSLNHFVPEPNDNTLTKIHFYAWKQGLKTGMYYLRMKAASSGTSFGQDAKSAARNAIGKDEDEKKYKIDKRGRKWICEDGSCCSA
jgi:ribonucleoside-diphosphate reductase alpha chain